MINSLLYVGRANLQIHAEECRIEDILATARSRNQDLDVTGALIYTRNNFAQLLEGPANAINQLMISIRRDPRHADVRIVREENNVTRRFEGWHMAYNGSSIFVTRHVRVLAASFAGPRDAQAIRLIDLMTSLTGSKM